MVRLPGAEAKARGLPTPLLSCFGWSILGGDSVRGIGSASQIVKLSFGKSLVWRDAWTLSRRQPNSAPTSLPSTATCRYPLVMLTFECPAASRTSANVRPPARAWLMNVCRPWWMVRLSSRLAPSTRHAVRNRFLRVCRENTSDSRPRRSDATNGSPHLALHAALSARQATVPASRYSRDLRGRHS